MEAIDDPFEQPWSEIGFRHQARRVHARPVGAEEHRLDSLAVHGFERVGDDEVDLLACEFGLGGGEEIGSRFERETDEELIGASGAGCLGE